MCRRRGPSLAGAILLAVLLPVLSGSALAADTQFHWNADFSGGYTGNVFYSDNNSVSSYGAGLNGNIGWTATAPRTSFDISVGTGYSWYDKGSANNLGQSLNAGWAFKSSEKLNWRAGVNGRRSEEQQYPVEDPSQGLTITQRVRRIDAEGNAGVSIRASQGLTLDVGLAYGVLKHGNASVVGSGVELVDATHRRGSLGASFAVSPTGSVTARYTYTDESFSPNRFTASELQVGEDFDGDGTIGVDTNGDGTIDAGGATSQFRLNESRSHGLNGGYGWQISDTSFGQVGAGLFRTKLLGTGETRTNWGVNASVMHQMSRNVSTQFGASRDVTSFYGLGGTAIGEVAWVNFNFQTGRNTTLGTGANWTRRKDLEDTGSAVRTASARADWRQRIGKWGGYFLSYDFVDQKANEGNQGNIRTAFLPPDRNLRFDMFHMGLFFGQGGQLGRPIRKPA